MMHAIDARTGIEVYAFIPFNLLAKLKALPDGNAIGSPDYFVDSSAKLADVRIGTAVATCAGSATDVLANVSVLRGGSRRHVLSGARHHAR